jgi:hypothetical protein
MLIAKGDNYIDEEINDENDMREAMEALQNRIDEENATTQENENAPQEGKITQRVEL